MAILVTQLNKTGLGTPPPGDPVLEGDINFIPTVFEAAGFSIDLKFEGVYVDANAVTTYLNAVSVTLTTSITEFGLTATKVNDYTYRIAGAYTNAFSNSYYQFLMRDLSLKILPPNTTEDFIALIRYKMPSPLSALKEIFFSVTIPADPIAGGANTTESVKMSQYVFWNFSSARASVISLVAAGEK